MAAFRSHPWFGIRVAVAIAALGVARLAHGYYEIPDRELEQWWRGRNIVVIDDGVVHPAMLKGGTVYRVSGFGTNGASYYVYLPQAYDLATPMPAIVGFDPAGNGKSPLMKFIPSAEERGWVVMGINDCANEGPPNQHAMVWDCCRHFRASFPHNRAREYTAGLSGGACIAFWYSRWWWDEFAGVFNCDGWMCDYDEHTYYPAALAVAHMRSGGDTGATGDHLPDARYLAPTGCRLDTIAYPGEHAWPPPATIDAAMDFLEADYQATGYRRVDSNGVATAANLLAGALAAVDARDWTPAATQALTVLHAYAYTPAVDGALAVIVDLFGDVDGRAQVAWPPALTNRGDLGRLMLQRGLGAYGEYPGNQARACFEAAVALDPNNAEACARLAIALVEPTRIALADLRRAQELARRATALAPDFWCAWWGRAAVSRREADFEAGLRHLETARPLTLAHYDPLHGKSRRLDRERDACAAGRARAVAVPAALWFDAGEVGESVDTLEGWHVPAGAGVIGGDVALAGGRALVLPDADSRVRINIETAGVETIWVDLYLIPAFSESPVEPDVFPASPAAYSFDRAGRLIARDGATWIAAAGVTVSDEHWLRLTMALDRRTRQNRLYLNDDLVLDRLAFASPEAIVDSVLLTGAGDGPVYVGAVGLSGERPPEDHDLDTLPDSWEREMGLDPASPADVNGADGDPDGDGLPNYLERESGTAPRLADTDRDGMADGAERAHGFDPLVRNAFTTMTLPSRLLADDYATDGWALREGTRPEIVQDSRVGGRALRLHPSLGASAITRYYASGPRTVVWLELTLMPTAGMPGNLTEVMKQGAALLCLNRDGHLVAYDGRAAIRRWVALEHSPVGEEQWVTVRARLDYRNKTWSVWHDGRLLADDLGFANPHKTEFSTITIQGSATLATLAASAAGPDSDQDAIPDDWELAFFGDLDHATVGTDADGDGFPDRSEYLAGTDPHDESDLLRILDVAVERDQMVVTWQSKPENYEGNPISYNLLRSRNLFGQSAQPVECDIRTDGVVCRYAVTNWLEDLEEFYQVEVKP